MKITIRSLTIEDEPFLWEMLYQAIYVPEGVSAPPRSIVQQPALAWYVQGWGREGDCGFLASTDTGQRVGVVWLRRPHAGQHGYGYVDDETPELSMALLPDYRGQGIGTLLFDSVFASPCMHPRVSLSVSAKNPARRLYERAGFVAVGQCGDSITMVKHEDALS